MKRLLVVALLAVAAALPSPAHAAAGQPVVELFTTSESLSRADLEAALPAFQTAVSRDLAPVWGTDATLIVGDPAHPQPADMTLTVADSLDCWFCGGYHYWTAKGQPYAKVRYDETEAWQLVLTHELFEMLVDPLGKRLSRWHARTWLVEVADPCESGFYAYWIDGIPISDFITPAWYSDSAAAPYDFAGRFVRAGQIGRHGYASWLNQFGHWNQVFG